MAQMVEQETTVTQIRNGETLIYTSNPVHLRALRKNPRAVERAGGEDWGQFTVAAGIFNPIKGFKRATKQLTDEQRSAMAERLQAARNR